MSLLWPDSREHVKLSAALVMALVDIVDIVTGFRRKRPNAMGRGMATSLISSVLSAHLWKRMLDVSSVRNLSRGSSHHPGRLDPPQHPG